jgi:hypothetical protein
MDSADLAQLVEHRIRNAGVGGSSPLVGTIFCICKQIPISAQARR